jgi:hypothetical protein
MVALQYKASQETVEFLVAKAAKDLVPEYYSDLDS